MIAPDKSFWAYSALWHETAALTIDFFAVPAPLLARELLGCVLFNGKTAGMIVETEAYLAVDDKAAHSYRGVTRRTKVIFGPPGRAYVYLIYGLSQCLNVVADSDGVPGCVLIRALEPLTGVAEMRERRKLVKGQPCDLTNGPGKLTQALAITQEHYGKRLDKGPLCIRRWKEAPIFDVDVTPRIGITECVDWPLRFVWRAHSCLSRHFVKSHS